MALGAVLYLTLLPFEFRQLSLAEAWGIYSQRVFSVPAVPHMGARAQWIANVLMFAPLGFFWMLWLTAGSTSRTFRGFAIAIVAMLSLLVTASVEFIQAWIPYRSPSLVDISGNFIGGGIGALVATFAGHRLWASGAAIVRGERPVPRDYLLLAYVVVYVFLSLFPFDFPWSLDEIGRQLAGDNWGLWAATGSCSGDARCLTLMVLKPLMAVPVGVWLLSRMSGPAALRIGLAVLAATAVAVGLELLQLLLYSGVAEGRSALLRGLGMVAGVVVGGWLSAAHLRVLRARWGLVASILLVIPYCVAVVGLVTGFDGYHWKPERALEQLQSLNFLPFYYHYFVSDSVAARSLIYQAIAYAPVGGLLWLGTGGLPRSASTRRRGVWVAGCLAVVLALVVEALKLFADDLRPDPTAVFVAMVVSVLVYRICTIAFEPPPASKHLSVRSDADDSFAAENQGAGWTADSVSRPTTPQAMPRESGASVDSERPLWFLRIIGLGLWGVALTGAVLWPVWAPWLVVGLLIYGAVLLFRPAVCLFAVPAAVPLLDWSLLTGFEVVDEFDLLVLTSIGSLLLVAVRGHGLPRVPAAFGWLLFLFTLSLLISSAVGLQDTLGLREQGVSAYFSEYAVLLATKGFLFALVLFLLIPQSGLTMETAFRRYFVPGMVVGLALVCAVVVWERAAYPGLLNFDSRYRISGLFTDMRVGGPSIETFLVLTLPFALLWLWLRPGFFRVLIVFALMAGGLHALLVTYSRAGYLGVAVSGLVIVALGFVAAIWGQSRWRVAVVMCTVAPAVLAGGLVLHYTDTFAVQRLGQIEQDMEKRLEHWQHVVELDARGAAKGVFGHGPGLFPRQFRLDRSPDRLPANYAFKRAGQDGQLFLGAGQSLYMNQRVPMLSGKDVELEVRGHSDSDARLNIFLCQKHIRYSFSCVTARTEFSSADPGSPQSSVFTLSTERLAQPEVFPPRHVTLAVRNGTRGSVIVLDGIYLRDEDGTELLRNPDFTAGGQHWYFTTDQLWPWRVENQWLEVYFDQGWFGLATFVLLTGFAVVYFSRHTVRHDFGYALLVASLLGVLALGGFSTVFFSPRLTVLFYLSLLLGVAAVHQPRTTSGRRRGV